MIGRKDLDQSLIKAIKNYDAAGCIDALDAGASPDAEDGVCSALFRAAVNGNEAIVELLCRRGARVNYAGQYRPGLTPLMGAFDSGLNAVDKPKSWMEAKLNRGEVARILLSHADISLEVKNIKNISYTNFLFWVVTRASAAGSAVDVLLDSGKVNVNDVDEDGNTALMVFAGRPIYGTAISSFLNRADIDVAVKNKAGKNVLAIALEGGSGHKAPENLASLLRFIVDKHKNDDSFEPFIKNLSKELNAKEVQLLRDALQCFKGKKSEEDKALRIKLKESLYHYLESTVNHYLNNNHEGQEIIEPIFDAYKNKRSIPIFEILRMGDRDKIDHDTGTWDKFSKLMKRVQAADVKVSKAGMHGGKKGEKELSVPMRPTTPSKK